MTIGAGSRDEHPAISMSSAKLAATATKLAHLFNGRPTACFKRLFMTGISWPFHVSIWWRNCEQTVNNL
jgi:hypothetical protein